MINDKDIALMANAMLSAVDSMRHEAREAREVVAHRGEDDCPGWLDRASALDEYADKIIAALLPIAEYLPAGLGAALRALGKS